MLGLGTPVRYLPLRLPIGLVITRGSAPPARYHETKYRMIALFCSALTLLLVRGKEGKRGGEGGGSGRLLSLGEMGVVCRTHFFQLYGDSIQGITADEIESPAGVTIPVATIGLAKV